MIEPNHGDGKSIDNWLVSPGLLRKASAPMDWKQVVGAVAPGLATLLGGPLAGGAVSLLADKLLGGSSGDPVADEARLAGLLSNGLTPEARAQVLAAEAQLKVELVKADVRKVEVAAETERHYVSDAADARRAHASSAWVMRLAVFINVASYLAIAGVLWGCFKILSSTVELRVDPGIAAMVGSLIGAAVQWLLSNASQANGFAFGSSPSSRELAANLGKSVAGTAAGLPRG